MAFGEESSARIAELSTLGETSSRWAIAERHPAASSICAIVSRRSFRAFAAFSTILVLFGCARSPQYREGQFLQRGKTFLAKQDYARAILEFRNAIRVAPSDAKPYYQLGLAYLDSRDLGDAFNAFTKAKELDPHHAGAQIKLAELTAAGGDKEMNESARARIQELLRELPPSAEALDALAMTQFRLGDARAARESLSKAIQQFPDHLKSAVALAKLEASQGHTAKAEEILQKAVLQSSQSPEAKLALADFYLSAQNAANAEKQFRSVLDSQPHNGLALLGLAAAQVEQGHNKQAEETYRQISLLGDPKYKQIYPGYLLSQKRYGEAIKTLEELAKADLRDRETRNRLVVACLLGNQRLKAEQIITKALNSNPKDADALILYAAILLTAGKYDQAEQKLFLVLTFRPDSDAAHALLSRVHQARGQTLEERQELNEALRINPNLLEARLELSRNLISGNAANAALEVLNESPKQQKEQLPWIVQRNWALLVSGDRAEADKGIQQGLARGRVPDLLLQSGLLKMQCKDYAGARRALDEALERSPEDPRLLWAVAQTYVLEGRASLASKTLQEYANERPHSAQLQLVLGEWLSKAGDQAGAKNAFLAAQAADPKSAQADFQLAQLEANEGKMEEAHKHFAELAKREGYQLTGQLWLANIDDYTRNYPAAINGYRKVLTIDPQNVIALNNLAYLLASQTNEADEALEFAQRAHELAPDNPDAEGTLGWILYRKGLYDTARKYLQDAVTKDGESSTQNAALRKYHLGETYLKLGNRESGLKAMYAALKINPNVSKIETTN